MDSPGSTPGGSTGWAGIPCWGPFPRWVCSRLRHSFCSCRREPRGSPLGSSPLSVVSSFRTRSHSPRTGAECASGRSWSHSSVTAHPLIQQGRTSQPADAATGLRPGFESVTRRSIFSRTAPVPPGQRPGVSAACTVEVAASMGTSPWSSTVQPSASVSRSEAWSGPAATSSGAGIDHGPSNLVGGCTPRVSGSRTTTLVLVTATNVMAGRCRTRRSRAATRRNHRPISTIQVETDLIRRFIGRK